MAGPTNEARAEGKLVFVLPCKKEEDAVRCSLTYLKLRLSEQKNK